VILKDTADHCGTILENIPACTHMVLKAFSKRSRLLKSTPVSIKVLLQSEENQPLLNASIVVYPL
jgi:hypothetical protein